MLKFITHRPFWVNLIAAIVIALLLLFIFLKMLGLLTKHGDYLTVPSIVGKKTDEAIKILEKQGFEVYIQDSVFTDTAERGIVLKQLPDPNATVKINRTVFITVNRMIPPMIDMPKLEGQSLRFAIDMLTRNHLQLGDTIYRPSFMMGSVLEQQYKGVRIAEKAKVQWGSRIDLIIGGGLEERQMLVPELEGMLFCEAKASLEASGIEVGAVIADGPISDTCSAYIIQQRPERFNEDKMPIYIKSGQVMDIWISRERKIIKDSANIQPQ